MRHPLAACLALRRPWDDTREIGAFLHYYQTTLVGALEVAMLVKKEERTPIRSRPSSTRLAKIETLVFNKVPVGGIANDHYDLVAGFATACHGASGGCVVPGYVT